ncbi:MAG: glycerol-3-phosphate dehydrogenase/oxidase [Chitinophagaceae bacterium]|nr:glycerol-3-phosphate dehydrogenase/oxidase [Chitinophagaceae bacterium]
MLGGIKYYDGQFDDARLAINIAQTAAQMGAVLLNYFKVTSLIKINQKVTGVVVKNTESGINYNVNAKVVINATGVFVDDILSMNEPHTSRL